MIAFIFNLIYIIAYYPAMIVGWILFAFFYVILVAAICMGIWGLFEMVISFLYEKVLRKKTRP